MSKYTSTFRAIVPAVLAAFLLATWPAPVEARSPRGRTTTIEVEIPVGTKIYCEMGQYVESKKPFKEDDRVRVHAWRDVIVDGHVVIPAGSPVDAHISLLKTNKVAGIKGKLEIAADGVTAVDGTFVPLRGGYGKQGKSNMALAITLAVVVLAPLIFIHGKKARLEPGALFDAYVDQVTTVEVEVPLEETDSTYRVDLGGPRLDLSGLLEADLSARILYDELQAQEKPKFLPMEVTVCGVSKLPELEVDTINGVPAKKVLGLKPREYQELVDDEDTCFQGTFTVKLKPLVKQFRQGINRFDVAYEKDGERISKELVLDVQI